MIITDKEIESARKMIAPAIQESEKYLGKITHWVISPCPSYFEGGENAEPCFEVCTADDNGQEGECVWMGTEWECYNIYVGLFGDENVLRSPLYSILYK